MTEPSTAPSRLLRPVAVATLVVSLAVAMVAGSASPSRAAEEARLTQPGSGATIDGPTPVAVEVDAQRVGEVERVEARLRRNGEIVGSAARLSHEGGDRSDGTSIWTAQWDPASGWINGGGSLANGQYRIEARAHSEVTLGEGETTEWSGHTVTVSQPAAVPELTADVGDDGQTVALRWSEAATSDFVRYELERAADDGPFETVARSSQRGNSSYRDEPPAPGMWRYRVATVSDDGAGGELDATSAAVTVETTDPDEGDDPEDDADEDDADEDDADEDDADEDDDSRPRPTPGVGDGTLTPASDADDEGDRSDGEGGDSDQAGDDGENGQGGANGGSSREPSLNQDGGSRSGTGSVPQLDDGEPQAQEPVAGEPAEDDFSRELPYDDPEFDVESDDDELAQADPSQSQGMIAVGDQELALERVLPPVAGGLLLFVTAGHILRLRQRLG